jgi:two pore calcium channel protein 3
VVVTSGLIAGIADEIEQADEKNQFFEVILILRVLRLIKLLGSIKRFRIIIDTVGIIVPSLFTYGMLVLTVFYMFSMIGLELFGATIKNQAYNYTLSSSQISQTYNCYNDFLTNTDFSK